MPKGLNSNQNEDNTPKPKNLTPEQQFVSKPKKNNDKSLKVDEKNNESKVASKQDDNQNYEQEENGNETKSIKTSESTIIPQVEGEQVPIQSITVIQNPKQITKFKVKRKKIEQRIISDLELDYYERLNEIRNKVDNPTPISRMNKRRKYTEDKRRNVTFAIREDLSYLMDDLVDDAKIYKGLFQDEIMILGMQEYIKKYGLK